MTLAIGTAAPPFRLPNQQLQPVGLDDLREKTVLVFIPFAFTRVCEGELCQIRDNFDIFEAADRRVLAVTCNNAAANARWAEEQGFQFDILSDFWPHGEVSRAYATFNERMGYAERTTYFLDENGMITDVIRSDELGEARSFGDYEAILGGTEGGS